MRIAFENSECIQNSLAEAVRSAMGKSDDLTTKEKIALAASAGLPLEVAMVGSSIHVSCPDRLRFIRKGPLWKIVDNQG